MHSSLWTHLILLVLLWIVPTVAAQEAPPETGDPVRTTLIGEAILGEGGYHLLQTMSDRYGPRMTGTSGNTQSMDWLEAQLQALGVETRREAFTFPGWVRSEDTVELVAPVQRSLRAAALGYVESHDPLEADVVYLDTRQPDTLRGDAYRGNIALLAPNVSYTAAQQQDLADRLGVVGLLMINRVGGGQLLARVANHDGDAPPFPIYTLTVEEGRWMQRALADDQPVRVRLTTRSYRQPMTVENLVAVLPGTSGQKVVVGAHFDSWDLGQGALDNGLGVAQLFEVARLLRGRDLHHTVELVWFNAEELGLWGSRRYVEQHALDDVRVMLNLDMVGDPQGVNAMGFDALVPLLTRFSNSLGSWSFERPVANTTWLGSDHHPFVLAGIPAITFYAPIDPDAVHYYHDFGDTFDKVDRATLARASALVTLLTHTLAQDTATPLRRYTPAETAALFQAAGLEDRLRRAGQWPFD